jgi:hypothetical protein
MSSSRIIEGGLTFFPHPPVDEDSAGVADGPPLSGVSVAVVNWGGAKMTAVEEMEAPGGRVVEPSTDAPMGMRGAAGFAF